MPCLAAGLAMMAIPATSPGGGLAQAATPITFGRETVVDPYRLSFEPSLSYSPDGTIYESPIFGFRTTQSFIQRSDDGGQTFNVLGLPGVGKITGSNPPAFCTGGGDSDVSVTPNNDLYMIDLGDAPEVPAHVSNDHGNTFTDACVANLSAGAVNFFADRQWLATDTVHNVEWYVYRDGLLDPGTGFDVIDHHVYGEYIFSAPLSSAPGTAGAAQLNFTSLCKDVASRPTSCLKDINVVGGAVTDNFGPKKGNTYLPVGNSPDGIENDVSVVVINPTAAVPVVERVVARKTSPVLFSTVAVDRAGNLFFAWVDNKTLQLRFASSTDQGKTWTAPRNITSPNFKTAAMPWLVAGDNGRVDLVFYASRVAGDPNNNFGPWDGWMLQNLDATNPASTWSETKFTDRPMHLDPICLHGTTCYTIPGTGGDRELGDFFKVTLDRDGRALIGFDDGNNQLGSETPGLSPFPAPSFATFVRQASGASLYNSVGNVPEVPRPTNSVTRGGHHNPVPFTSPTGPGADNPALKLLGSAVTYTPTGIRVTLRASNFDPAVATAPPALPVATYLTKWWYKGALYYAAGEYSAAKGWTFFSGQAAPVLTSNNVGYAFYPASGPATGTVQLDGRMTIDVASADVGNPPAGANLYSVTSYALTHALPTPPTPPSFSNFTDYPQIGDSMPAYNVEGASTTVATPARTTPAVTAATNNLPNTASASIQAVLSLALLAATAAVLMAGSAVRRRRRANVNTPDQGRLHDV